MKIAAILFILLKYNMYTFYTVMNDLQSARRGRDNISPGEVYCKKVCVACQKGITTGLRIDSEDIDR